MSIFSRSEFDLKRVWWFRVPEVQRIGGGPICDVERDMAKYLDSFPNLPGPYSQIVTTENAAYRLPKPKASMSREGVLYLDFGTHAAIRDVFMLDLFVYDHKGRCILRTPVDEKYPAGHKFHFFHEVEDSGEVVYTTDQMVAILMDAMTRR